MTNPPIGCSSCVAWEKRVGQLELANKKIFEEKLYIRGKLHASQSNLNKVRASLRALKEHKT